MKLSQMETQVQGLGFLVKSLKTGRTFKVTGKSPKGTKYMLELTTDPTKEYPVSDVDGRYELTVDTKAKRIVEIHAQLSSLDAEATRVNDQIDTLSVKADELEHDMNVLEEELMELTGESN